MAISIVKTVEDMRRLSASWRSAGERVALVPTMGALHVGHISLVEAAKRQADRVVASIFINPKQFGPNEDFARYPRTEREDMALLGAAQADAVFMPAVEAMYPEGFNTNVSVRGVSEGLCGAARPGHFDGVATVVAKLLLAALPDAAFFGEKDYQQLQVIRRLVRDLNIPVAIHAAPTLREEDGLAMSSRNRYLSEAERAIAPSLYRTLQGAAEKIRAKQSIAQVIEQSKAALLKDGFTRIDYFEVCDAKTLQPLQKLDKTARILAAVFLGTTRLIDNIAI